MRNITISIVLSMMMALLAVPTAYADEQEAQVFDADAFAHKYLEARTATQQPNATAEHLEQYLSLLTEDVGYQHLPYNSTDTREPDGKQHMRAGMTHYLGKNTSFTAELQSVTHDFNVVVIKYSGVHQYQRPGEAVTTKHYTALDVLELENGKVSVVREYRK